MADIIVQSGNSGEWSPLLDGRSDLEKYYSANRIVKNMIPTPYGPSDRRPGTYYVAELKDKAGRIAIGAQATSRAAAAPGDDDGIGKLSRGDIDLANQQGRSPVLRARDDHPVGADWWRGGGWKAVLGRDHRSGDGRGGPDLREVADPVHHLRPPQIFDSNIDTCLLSPRVKVLYKPGPGDTDHNGRC